MNEDEHRCVACNLSSQEIPLLRLEYQGHEYWICPHDFPTLLHQPQKLIGLLPGAEKLHAHEH